MAEASGWFQRARSWCLQVEHLLWAPLPTNYGRARLMGQRWLQILLRSIVGFIESRAASTASALTYTTLLTLVPLLAIIVPLLKAAGVYEDAYSALLVQIDRLLPQGSGSIEFRDHVLQIVNGLRNFLNNTNLSNLGIYGVGGLLLAVLSLFSNIEQAMNDAWGIGRSRSVLRKVLDYLGLLAVLVFLLAALSLTATSGFLNNTGHWWDDLGFSYMQAVLLKCVPLLVAWPTFALLYHFLPNTRVRWRSAMLSGLATASLFQLMQFAFFRFHRLLDGYNRLYGAFAYIVILFVMIYTSWCVVLWGVHLCSAHQNLRDLRRRRRPWHNTPAERETLALRLAALLARLRSPEQAGEMSDSLAGIVPGSTADIGELADALMLPPSPLGEMLTLFEAQGLAARERPQDGYRLTREPRTISVYELLHLVREGSQPAAQGLAHSGPLSSLSGQLIEPLRALNVADLARLPLDQINTLRL